MVYKNKTELLPHRFFSLFEHFLSFLLKETWCVQAMRKEVQLVFISTTMFSCLWNSSSYCETPCPSKHRGCRGHAIWLARKKQGGVALKGLQQLLEAAPSHSINTFHICWIILRRTQAGFCCSWLLPVCKPIPFETSWGTTGYTTLCSKEWPYRVTKLAAGKLLWFKVQYFYQRNSHNTASTETSQSYKVGFTAGTEERTRSDVTNKCDTSKLLTSLNKAIYEMPRHPIQA